MSKELEKRVLDEIQRRENSDPLRYKYSPHSAQLELHRSRSPITVVLGANRAGKTYCCVAEALFNVLGYEDYGPTPPAPIQVWYVMPTLSMFHRAILKILNSLVPRHRIRKPLDRRLHYIEFDNGSTLHFLSEDMGIDRLQAASVDLCIMDETPKEAIFDELQARVLSRKGRIIIAFTPVPERLEVTRWVQDRLVIPAEIGERSDITLVYMPLADKEGNPLVPHFSKQDIAEAMERWPDPAVRAARIFGEFVNRMGSVFKDFNPDVHVIPPFDTSGYTRWLVCDPQYYRFAVLSFCQDEQGTYYVTGELFSQEEPMARRVERLAVMIGETSSTIPMYVDSANPQEVAELNWHFSRLGIPVAATQLPFKKSVEDFLLRTQSLLSPDPSRPYNPRSSRRGIYGAPRLQFFSSLSSHWRLGERDVTMSRLLWELSRASWGSDGKIDKKSAGGADCLDCLLYGCSLYTRVQTRLDKEDPYAGLPPADRVIWEAVDRVDRMGYVLQDDYQ